MTIRQILVAAALVAAGPAVAADRQLDREPAAEAPVARFLGTLQSGKVDGAVEALLSTPAWSSKTAEIATIRNQLTTSIQVYGPVQGYELVQSDRVGTTALRQYYLVRHAKMVTRWEFDMVRIGDGWVVAYLGFEDQVKTWF